MVAEQQSRNELALEEPLMSLSVSYDGKPKIAQTQHAEEVDASYKTGYEAASSQYNQQILDFRSEVNALREGTFSQIESKFATLVSEAREALMTLTYDCVVRTLGGYELPAEAVAKIVDSIATEAGLNEEKMEVRLHSTDIALLQDLEPELKGKHPGMEFVADDTLGRGDCSLSSRFGKVDGLISTKLENLKGSLKPS